MINSLNIYVYKPLIKKWNFSTTIEASIFSEDPNSNPSHFFE